MQFDVQGKSTHCFDARVVAPGCPTAVFIHGALNDHSVWGRQAANLAANHVSVLAPDLPGHGRSEGPALGSVEAMADWLIALLDAAQIPQAVLVGHSMGSLIALEVARKAPQRVGALALLGSTYPMRVSDALLAQARDDEAAAIGMVAQWSHSPDKPASREASVRLMVEVAANNPGQLLYLDLNACRQYANGEAAARAVTCPVLMVVGTLDKMTPARSATLLTESLANARVVEVLAGHQMMIEQPDQVSGALLDFIGSLPAA
jgi:pimeloyl-ACP methyl ester carboxylesterase